jgi:hypothetical protein
LSFANAPIKHCPAGFVNSFPRVRGNGFPFDGTAVKDYQETGYPGRGQQPDAFARVLVAGTGDAYTESS